MGKLNTKERSYLDEKFGSRVCFRKTERKLYGHDIAAMPSLTVSLPDAAETLALAATDGPMSTQQWDSLTNPSGLIGDFQPVAKPLPGHAAMMVMEGRVDGTEVVTEAGDTLLLRGANAKEVVTTEEAEVQGDKIKRRLIERETIATIISALNLNTGNLDTHHSKTGPAEFEDFLRQHQDKLIGAVDTLYPPLFVANRDMPLWFKKLKRIHGPRPLPGAASVNGLLPKQAECAVALAMLMDRQKAGLLIGECGVGKTCISLALQGLTNGGNFKIVVMAPAQTLPKWKREAERVLQEFNLKAHIIGEKRGRGRGKPVLDIVEAMEEDNPSLLAMSFETAKNGAPWEAAFNVKKRKMEWWETKVKRLDWYPYKEEVEVKKEAVLSVACCPDCGVILLDEENGKPWPVNRDSKFWKRQKRFCECGAALFQEIGFRYGGRVAAARFLNRRYPGKFVLILDEAHNTKGRDTDIGQASMMLISAARRVIGMTGTIYNGKASGIFAILYRFLPLFRQLYEFDQVKRFVDHHGLQETITTRTDKVGSRYSSSWGYSRENQRVREIPGVTPAIISWILRMSVFIRKEHVSAALPSYTEYRVPVRIDEDQSGVLLDLGAAHKDACHEAFKGKPGLLSQWLYAACGALDFGKDDLLVGDDSSYMIRGCTRPGKMLPKDAAILDIVKKELAEGRGVGIYFAQVNRRDWMPRFQKLLGAEGIYSEILRADTCKKGEREEWFQGLVKRCQAKGQPVVLLANGNLVKEGLDLVECPTLIETGIDFRLINILQRDQRAHRIIQEKDCKVYFLYYENTFQEKALSVVAAKARAAKKVEGKLIDGLAQMGAEEDLMSALMKAAQDEEQDFTAVDWGDLQVEDIRPVVCDLGVLPKEKCPICSPPPVHKEPIELVCPRCGSTQMEDVQRPGGGRSRCKECGMTAIFDAPGKVEPDFTGANYQQLALF